MNEPFAGMLAGPGSREVIDRLQSRLRGADPSSDPAPERKLGLIVEGGAMRGCYTGGCLVGLHIAGAVQSFDAVYATSAGVINAAHFLSGVGPEKAGTYYRALAGSEFINPLRFWKMVDIDYVLDRVLRQDIPLELPRLLENPTRFHVALLNYESGLPEMYDVQSIPESAWDVIHASIAMPVLYNRTVDIGGSSYFDAGLAVPFPLMEAIEDGCDDLVVLLSRDPAVDVVQRSSLQRQLFSLLFAKGRRDLLDLFDRWPNRLHELQDLATGVKSLNQSGVRIATIYPSPATITSSTKDKAALRLATLSMARQTAKLLGANANAVDALANNGVL